MFDYDDYDVDYGVFRGDRRAHRQATLVPNRKPKRPVAEVVHGLTDVLDNETGIAFTYQASRHEHGWLMQALGSFFFQGIITDVLRLAKGGKEANVYVCAANPGLGPPFLAAKVYRPRRFRNLRNDALYRVGRVALDWDGKLVKDSRAIHAMQKGTGKGKEMSHTSWLAHELTTMQRLHEAGADVPRPFGSGDNVILMAYIGDAASPAPTLNHVTLRPAQAAALFDRVMANVEAMLAQRRVHGDLSAYNILYWRGQITIIDFPQAVDPYENPAARRIFGRDVERVCEYFAGFGVSADPAALAEAIWGRHVPADLWVELPDVPEEL
jgi:RIO kinase 1